MQSEKKEIKAEPPKPETSASAKPSSQAQSSSKAIPDTGPLPASVDFFNLKKSVK